MKQDERFNSILNLCLDRVLGGETVEQCLRDYPDQAKELKPLLQTALAAKMASAVEPRREFKARARVEFQAALRDMKSNRKQSSSFFHWRWQWQPAWSIALAVLVIFILGGGGSIIAARNVMPDNPLYSVKLFTENVQLALTPSDTGKTELNAKFADRRAEEIVYAASNGNAPEARTAAGRLNSNMMNITNLTGNSIPAASNQNNFKIANDTAATGQENQTAAVQAVPQPAAVAQPAAVPAAPPAVQPAAPPAAVLPETPSILSMGTPGQEPSPTWSEIVTAPAAGGQWTAGKGAVPETAPQPAADTPNSPNAETTEVATQRHSYGLDARNSSGNKLTEQEKMRQVINYNYAVLQSRLEAALEAASPDVRQIIRQAIAQAQSEYEKALKNLDLADLSNAQNNHQ
jgi:hypothetical protein